jgi:hypothetical protein
MARNGKKNSPTNAGGRRRPEGAYTKLAEDFLADLERLWQQHGREVLQRLATERPAAFFQVMIKLARVQPLELGPPEESGCPCNREEVLQRWRREALPHASARRGRFSFELPSNRHAERRTRRKRV